MEIIISLKNDEIIKIYTTSVLENETFLKNFSEVLTNNSNHLFFDNGFDKKIMVMKDLIKTIEFIEVSK